jgi:hypothetical protein
VGYEDETPKEHGEDCKRDKDRRVRRGFGMSCNQSGKAFAPYEMEVLNRAGVSIPAKDWKAFNACVARLPVTVPALAELAREMPSWKH